MKTTARVTGARIIIKNLDAQLEQVQFKTRSGLRAAALVIRAESQKLCPVDTGNLINSAYTDLYREGDNLIAEIGYAASYAAFVHENTGATFRKPGAEPKFLEKAIDRNRADILRIIKERAKV
jgi:HK97 gp10 family phage protein